MGGKHCFANFLLARLSLANLKHVYSFLYTYMVPESKHTSQTTT